MSTTRNGDASRRGGMLLVAGAICVSIVLSEAAFRMVKHVVCLTAGATLFQPHPVYGWGHEPQAEGWTHGCVGRAFEWSAFSRMNARGLRDRAYPYARKPGVARILFLGDSFVEGMQVPLEQTVAKRLEADLARDGLEVEVINAGVSGFGTDNELLYFATEGRRYQADVVLLGITPANDVIESSRGLYARMYADNPDGAPPKSHFELGPDRTLRLDVRPARRRWEEFEARRTSWLGRTWLALERNLHVVRLARAVLRRSRLPQGATRVARSTLLGVYAVPASSEWNDAWALTDAILGELQAEVERRGATFAAVIFPAKEVVSTASWHGMLETWPDPERRALDVEQPTRMVTAMLARRHVPYLDLLPALRAHLQATGRTGYFGWDIHLTEEGHAIAAEALRPFVERLLAEHERLGAPRARETR